MKISTMNLPVKLTQIFAFLSLVLCMNGAKILAVFPSPSYSHQIVYQPIWRELSLRGHQVTVMTTDPLNDPTLKNLTEISWKKSYVIWRKVQKMLGEPLNIFQIMEIYSKTAPNIMDEQLSHPEVHQLINDKDAHFDLVIVEWLFTEMAAFSERFKCPLIGLSSLGATTPGHDEIGNPSHPAYNPDLLLPFHGHLTLFQRIISTVVSVWIRYYKEYDMRPHIEKIMKKHFGEDLAPLAAITRNISVLLLNVNSIFYPIRPNVPAVVELGGIGIHIKPPKPLPQDIQTYLDDSEKGAIYFSLGTNFLSSTVTSEKVDVIKDALRQLPYNILWKWEHDEMPDKPNNVKIAKWLPQQDILAHPNIKLFITQGGLQSLQEALYYKIPCLGMSFLPEQQYNLVGAINHGFAKHIDFNSVTKEVFKDTIIEMISNPEYKRKVSETADLVMDEPMKPLDKAVWWIEYVIRHKGARHLRSPAVDMPWYQYLLLDVLAILFSAIFIIIFVAYKILKFIVIFIVKFTLKAKLNLFRKMKTM